MSEDKLCATANDCLISIASVVAFWSTQGVFGGLSEQHGKSIVCVTAWGHYYKACP